MTDEELDAIEARANDARASLTRNGPSVPWAWERFREVVTPSAVLALVVEVRRLRGVVRFADERLIGKQDDGQWLHDYEQWEAMR